MASNYSNLARGGLSSAQVSALISSQVPDPLTLVKGGTGAITAVGAFDALNTQGSNIASASSINLAAATGTTVTITGTTTITALGTAAAGVVRRLLFTGCLCFTYNGTSLILPDSHDLFCVPGDVATFVSLGSGNWKLVAFEPIHPLENEASINIASACTATNTGTVSGNGYFNTSNWLIYVNTPSVGYGKVIPHTGSGIPGFLPQGTTVSTIGWGSPWKLTVKVAARVSTKSTSAGAFGFFFGCSPTSMALAAKGAMFICRGTDATSAVSHTAYTHDGTTLATGTSTNGTLTTASQDRYQCRWVPGQGFFVFRNGNLVSKSTSNLPTGDGPSDSNIFGWCLENVTGNSAKAEAYFNSIVVAT